MDQQVGGHGDLAWSEIWLLVVRMPEVGKVLESEKAEA